jgi:Peptidase inhibitor family I36/Domain of unknown function (DUF4214)
MTNRLTISHCVAVAFLAGALGVVTETTASAQPRWGRPNAPRAGACFYRDANFQGDYFCAQAGEEIPNLPGRMNDEISSIRTFGGADVAIYQRDDFGGRSTRFTSDVSNLQQQGWNDRLSSIRVAGRFAGGPGWNSGPGWNGGSSVNGGSRDVRSVREADQIIDRAYRDILRREPDPQGRREYRNRLLNDGWSEDQLRQTLRRSDERQDRVTETRARLSRARAEQTVREAYLSVLNREPDPASSSYVDRVVNEGWSQEDVARALRESEEFRSQRRRR